MEFSLEEPATESLVAVVVTAETVERKEGTGASEPKNSPVRGDSSLGVERSKITVSDVKGVESSVKNVKGVQKLDTGDGINKKDSKLKETAAVGDVWSLFSPAKSGRLGFASAKRVEELLRIDMTARKETEVQISASKFSVLSMDVEEEGEILPGEKHKDDEDLDAGNNELEELESDLMEEEELEQQVNEEAKVGKRRGRKP
ncbi:hypothetical protein Bca4012_025894 [Brassica carinata]